MLPFFRFRPLFLSCITWLINHSLNSLQLSESEAGRLTTLACHAQSPSLRQTIRRVNVSFGRLSRVRGARPTKGAILAKSWRQAEGGVERGDGWRGVFGSGSKMGRVQEEG